MREINTRINSVTAFAPATCANVVVGFDVLGFAVAAVGDSVTLTLRNDKRMIISAIHSREKIPLDVSKNTASAVILKACLDLELEVGFTIEIHKGIPLSSGLGGSAASAVAALVAFNEFLNKPLSLQEIAQYALQGEEIACGQAHADNVVPCLFGGFTLIYSVQPMEIVHLPSPELYCTLIHPHLQVSTREARTILKEQITLSDHVYQSGLLAGFISSLYTNDENLMKKTMVDTIIEPQRAHFVPGFEQLKQIACDHGAIGCSYSGSGPTVFSLAKTEQHAKAISYGMQAYLGQFKISSDTWISPIAKKAAYVKEINGASL